VLDAHLAVIARLNSKLNAIVTLAPEQARDLARAAEAVVRAGAQRGDGYNLSRSNHVT
jgi:amidase